MGAFPKYFVGGSVVQCSARIDSVNSPFFLDARPSKSDSESQAIDVLSSDSTIPDTWGQQVFRLAHTATSGKLGNFTEWSSTPEFGPEVFSRSTSFTRDVVAKVLLILHGSYGA